MIQYILSDRYNTDDVMYYEQLPRLTEEIGKSYSGHLVWLNTKFLPGLHTKTRGYSFAIDDRTDWLSGCTLLKNEPSEKKLCCLFVDPNYRKLGIASKLVENSFELLRTDKPVMTVSEQNLSQLQPIIKRYGFELTSVKESVYKQGVREYFYNEGLAR